MQARLARLNERMATTPAMTSPEKSVNESMVLKKLQEKEAELEVALFLYGGLHFHHDAWRMYNAVSKP